MKVNLGTGQGHSVREVLETVEKVTGRKVPAREVGRRAGDPPGSWPILPMPQSSLRWKPKYADLGRSSNTRFGGMNGAHHE